MVLVAYKSIHIHTTHEPKERYMNRSSVALTLGLLLCVPLAPAAFAQGTPPAITEQEAHAIGVDACVYYKEKSPTITISGTRGAIPLGRAIGDHNVVNNTTNLFPGNTGLSGPTDGTGWFFNGSVSANIPSYAIDWYFVGSESQQVITLRSWEPAFSHTEANENNNFGSRKFNSLVRIATTVNTSSLIPLTLRSDGNFVAENGGQNASAIAFAYVNFTGTGWTISTEPTDWFAFCVNDNGTADRDFDDYVGVAHVRFAPVAQQGPGPIPGTAVLGLLRGLVSRSISASQDAVIATGSSWGIKDVSARAAEDLLRWSFSASK